MVRFGILTPDNRKVGLRWDLIGKDEMKTDKFTKHHLVRAVSVAILASVMTVAASASYAAVYTAYTDKAAFLGAVSGANTIDFEGDHGTAWNSYISTTLTLGGVDFFGGSYMHLVDTDYGGCCSVNGSDFLLGGRETGRAITATLNSGAQAVGFDFVSPDNNVELVSTIFNLLINGTDNLAGVSSSALGASFFGVISSSTIETLRISNQTNGLYLSIDNFVYGNVSAVPLPPSAILFGTALLGLAGLRRRKRKAA